MGESLANIDAVKLSPLSEEQIEAEIQAARPNGTARRVTVRVVVDPGGGKLRSAEAKWRKKSLMSGGDGGRVMPRLACRDTCLSSP